MLNSQLFYILGTQFGRRGKHASINQIKNSGTTGHGSGKYKLQTRIIIQITSPI